MLTLIPNDYDEPWPGASPDIGSGSWIGVFTMAPTN
jgi:hypothetical protein